MDKIILFSSQTDIVKNVIKEKGICFSKRDYVQKKYGESAKIFINNYDWLVENTKEMITKEKKAEYPYFAFTELYNVENSKIVKPLMLNVPLDECILFDMNDWTKIMRFEYIGENELEAKKYNEDLKMRGLTNYDIIMSNFYLEEKQKLFNSWKYLFKYDKVLKDEIKNNKKLDVKNIEAVLFCIKKEWVVTYGE